MSLYDQTNAGTRRDIAEALGFPRICGDGLLFIVTLKEIPELLGGWTVADAVLAYLDHIRKRYE